MSNVHTRNIDNETVQVIYQGETVTIGRYDPIVEIIDTLYIDLGMSEEQADRLAFRLAR